MLTRDFDYDLPPDRIAQTPMPRGESRLLVVHRNTGQLEHREFGAFPEYLKPSDVLVLNDTRVIARRLEAERESGSPAEILLLRQQGKYGWEALVKPGISVGKTLTLKNADGEAVMVKVTALTSEGGRLLEFASPEARDKVGLWGVAPLPPYIHAALPHEQEERYQTVFAANNGSAAAPTAGLHFTDSMLDELSTKGVEQVYVTLHVGVDTFRPVKVETLADHEMHGEWASLSHPAAEQINRCKGRVFAIGTTAVRTLETAAQSSTNGRVVPFIGETRLFITPGYQFRAVDALLTNFHLPKSTLLMLVSAFAGIELVRHAYEVAIAEGYRFFSFGDAMLIV